MRTQATADVEHLQERLNRLENELRKLARVVGPLNQQAQITGQNPGQGSGVSAIYYGTVAAGTTIAAGGSGTVTLNGGGPVTVQNVAGTVTAPSSGPLNVIVGLMVDGTYSLLVAPCGS